MTVTSTGTPTSIVVPVYRGLRDVEACIESLLSTLSHATRPARLLVIDDASPDAEVTAFIESVRERSTDQLPIRVDRNPENLGFVATVNRGFRETDGDVVVLNADTIVTPGWFDRMSEAATSGPDVATVTPLTNFGSLATIPHDVVDHFGLDGPEPDVHGAAAFIENHSLRIRPEVISAVGFCMYVRRDALDAVGLFDERSFGRGYGEEVDFSLRAGRAGFVHLIEDSTFVFHRGGGSFGEERETLRRKASGLLHRRYPFFREANEEERRHNPLAPTFAALTLGLTPRDDDRPHVLYLMHSSPEALGGTEKHVAMLTEALSGRLDVSTLYPVESGYLLRTKWQVGGGTVNVEFDIPAAARRVKDVHDENAAFALRCVLDLFDFDAVHIQNIIGHSLAPLSVLEDFEGPVVYSLRDQFLACPHHWLMYRNEEACGVPKDLDVCATCLPLTKNLPIEHLHEHRSYVQDHIGRIDHIVVASRNSADYLLRAYDVDPGRFVFIEHGTLLPVEDRIRELDAYRVWDEPLRVAFAGQGRKKKGIDLVEWLAVELEPDGIEVHHFGEVHDETSPHVIEHGRYDNRWLPELLDLAGMHAVLLPGQYAETFGHVMTEALLAGLPVIGAEFGALAERIYRDGVGWTVDPSDPARIAQLLRDLDTDRAELERVTRRVHRAPLRHTEETAGEYADLYGTSTPTAARRNSMSELESRQRRQLRAMALLNRELRAAKSSGSGDETPSSRREKRKVEKTLRSREREIADLKDAYAASRKRARTAENQLESLLSRKSVRLALSMAKLARPFSSG